MLHDLKGIRANAIPLPSFLIRKLHRTIIPQILFGTDYPAEPMKTTVDTLLQFGIALKGRSRNSIPAFRRTVCSLLAISMYHEATFGNIGS